MNIGEEDGYATLSPTADVVAGEYGTWTLTYVAGKRGLSKGGALKIYTDSDTDWGLPQVQDPAGADYLTCEAPTDAGIAVIVKNYKTLLLAVHGKGLSAGESVKVTWGDRTRGGPGSRAQTFYEAKHYFWVSVDPDGKGEWVSLPNPPSLRILGGEPERLEVTVPSMVALEKPFRIQVRLVDKWGNPSQVFRGRIDLTAAGVDLPADHLEFTEKDGGVIWLEGCRAGEIRILRVEGRFAGGDLQAASNPLQCHLPGEEFSLFWGDYHGGQVELAERIPGFFRHARDVAALSFVSHQRNDFMMSNEDWEVQLKAEKDLYEPGRFVPIPGFEWSPNTSVGGHHNIYFHRHDQRMRRCHHGNLEDRSDEGEDLPHISDVYRAYRNTDTLITPHVGGEHSNLAFHEPNLERAVEVTSTHGSFEWFLRETLERGYRLGFFGGSDSHTGRPGDDRPGHQHRRYAKSGLAGVYAREVTIAGFLEALKARRCYATTGARMIVHVASAGHFMGEEFTTHELPEVAVRAEGTEAIEAVELYRGLDRIYTHSLPVRLADNRVRILWEGASRTSSYSGVAWEGGVSVDCGRILEVGRVRFDSPRSHLTATSDTEVGWYSVTCGYGSGLILELDGELEEMSFACAINSNLISGNRFGHDLAGGTLRMAQSLGERVRFEVSGNDLREGPVSVEIGELDRKVTFSLAPADNGEKNVEFSYRDEEPRSGTNPYWVRVVQTDKEMAWTSPVFVEYLGSV